MTRLRPLAALLGLAAVLALVAVLGRYEVVAVGTVAVARLDRWTGRTLLCAGARGCVGLKMQPATYAITTPAGVIHRVTFDHTPTAAEIDDAAALAELRALSDADLLKQLNK